MQVLPSLLNKREAIDIYVKCEAENDADEEVDSQAMPAFLETLATIAIDTADTVYSRVSKGADPAPDTLSCIKRYATGCAGAYQETLNRAIASLIHRKRAAVAAAAWTAVTDHDAIEREGMAGWDGFDFDDPQLVSQWQVQALEMKKQRQEDHQVMEQQIQVVTRYVEWARTT